MKRGLIGRILLVIALQLIIAGIVKDHYIMFYIGCFLSGVSAGLGWTD